MNRKKQFLMSFKCAHYNDNFAILRRVYLCFHIESPFPLIAEEDEDTQRLPNLCDSFKWPRLRIIFNEDCEIFECSLIILPSDCGWKMTGVIQIKKQPWSGVQMVSPGEGVCKICQRSADCSKKAKVMSNQIKFLHCTSALKSALVQVLKSTFVL